MVATPEFLLGRIPQKLTIITSYHLLECLIIHLGHRVSQSSGLTWAFQSKMRGLFSLHYFLKWLDFELLCKWLFFSIDANVLLTRFSIKKGKQNRVLYSLSSCESQ